MTVEELAQGPVSKGPLVWDNRDMKDIDHIDPSWKKGRKYQLICGLDTSLNFAERDTKLNIQKSNRFLPWRVTVGEIGSIPENPGDWCLFLDPDTLEWTLQEFMGEWWMSKTKRTCGPSAGRIGIKRPDLVERNKTNNPSKKGKVVSDETRQKLKNALKGKPKSEAHKTALRKPKNLNDEQRQQLAERSQQTAIKNKRNNNGQFTK